MQRKLWEMKQSITKGRNRDNNSKAIIVCTGQNT